MKKFIMFGSYCPDVAEKRKPFRDEHLFHLRDLKNRGILEKAGPTADLSRIFAIFLGEEEQEIRKHIEEDVYWRNNIWTEYQLLEWIDAV